MKDVTRIAIVDPSDDTREPLRNLLMGVESVWLEAECSRYEFFPDVVHQSNPDMVVVALDNDHAKAVQLIAQLSASAPAMPILAVSGRDDGQSILQALRSGAREFLAMACSCIVVNAHATAPTASSPATFNFAPMSFQPRVQQ